MNDNKQGIATSVWGSPLWLFLHAVAINYDPNTDKEKYFNFFVNLSDIIPCRDCQIHYKENVIKQELLEALNSNESFFRYIYDLHNKVNKQIGIPESKYPSYESIKKRYESYKADCSVLPGVCESGSEMKPKIKVVEQFGSYSDDQVPYIISNVILGALLVMALLYIFYIKKNTIVNVVKHKR